MDYYSAIKKMKFCHLQQHGYTFWNKSERERKIPHVTTWYLESKKYWVGQKVYSSFTITFFGKTQMNFLANPSKQMNEYNKTEIDSQIKRTN